MSDDYTCPGCTAHPEFGECWHSANEWALAEAIRDAVEKLHPNPSGWEPGSIEGASYFIQDAEGLPNYVGEPPYSVVMTHPIRGGNYSAVGVVNSRYLFGCGDGEGDSYADFLGDLGGFLVPAGSPNV
jgi:hypothetical protein